MTTKLYKSYKTLHVSSEKISVNYTEKNNQKICLKIIQK